MWIFSLKFALPYAPDLSGRVVQILISFSWSRRTCFSSPGSRRVQLAQVSLCAGVTGAHQRRCFDKRLFGLFFDSCDELRACGNVMNQTDDLPRCPNLERNPQVSMKNIKREKESESSD